MWVRIAPRVADLDRLEENTLRTWTPNRFGAFAMAQSGLHSADYRLKSPATATTVTADNEERTQRQGEGEQLPTEAKGVAFHSEVGSFLGLLLHRRKPAFQGCFEPSGGCLLLILSSGRWRGELQRSGIAVAFPGLGRCSKPPDPSEPHLHYRPRLPGSATCCRLALARVGSDTIVGAGVVLSCPQGAQPLKSCGTLSSTSQS